MGGGVARSPCCALPPCRWPQRTPARRSRNLSACSRATSLLKTPTSSPSFTRSSTPGMSARFCRFHSHELPAQQRADTVSSLLYDCLSSISYLQQQVSQFQVQLALARPRSTASRCSTTTAMQSQHQLLPRQHRQSNNSIITTTSRRWNTSLIGSLLCAKRRDDEHVQQRRCWAVFGAATAMMLQEA